MLAYLFNYFTLMQCFVLFFLCSFILMGLGSTIILYAIPAVGGVALILFIALVSVCCCYCRCFSQGKKNKTGLFVFLVLHNYNYYFTINLGTSYVIGNKAEIEMLEKKGDLDESIVVAQDHNEQEV